MLRVRKDNVHASSTEQESTRPRQLQRDGEADTGRNDSTKRRGAFTTGRQRGERGSDVSSTAGERQEKTPLGLGNYGTIPKAKTAKAIAKWYWEEYGLVVIPAKRGDKMPISKWAEHSHYFEEVDWMGYSVDAVNYACLTGPSGVTVVDYDYKPDGGYTPPYGTLTIATPRGTHKYYRITDREIGNSVNKEQKIDIRGIGGITILPPSLNDKAIPYSIVDNSPIREITYEEFLSYWPWHEEVQIRNEPGWFAEEFDHDIGEGSRNDTCAKYAGYLLNGKLTINDVTEILYAWNKLKCIPSMSIREVRTVVESVARKDARNGPKIAPNYDSELEEARADPSNPFA